MAIESLRYQTVYQDKKFEIREYEDYIVAEVEIDGDFGSALHNTTHHGSQVFFEDGELSDQYLNLREAD